MASAFHASQSNASARVSNAPKLGYIVLMSQEPHVDVWMVHRDLARAPRFALPPGYRIRRYREGDVAAWGRIQNAADTMFVATAKMFAESMPGDAAYLAERILFLVDPHGTDIGTIAAWNDTGFDGSEMGHVHWVAMVPEAQGRGLAKPMLSAALEVMRGRRDAAAWLETNTARIPALNLYLLFGFEPHPRDDAEREAWRAIAPRLRHRIEV
jgi:GNAT superfamily N-acetyltransferase